MSLASAIPANPLPASPAYRYVLGPALGVAFTTPGVPAPVVAPAPDVAAPVATKTDPTLSVVAVDPVKHTVKFHLPRYDLATTNQLMELRVYMHPVVGGVLPPPLADGPSYLASGLPYLLVDMSDAGAKPGTTVVGDPDGVTFTLSLLDTTPTLPPGVQHVGQTVLGLAG